MHPLPTTNLSSSNPPIDLHSLQSCYTSYHPDSKAWLPGKAGAAHTSFWARMEVEGVRYVGGFGE